MYKVATLEDSPCENARHAEIIIANNSVVHSVEKGSLWYRKSKSMHLIIFIISLAHSSGVIFSISCTFLRLTL